MTEQCKNEESTKPVRARYDIKLMSDRLDRLTKDLDIQLDAIKRSKTITAEMLNRRITI